jgi:hypothetical protein
MDKPSADDGKWNERPKAGLICLLMGLVFGDGALLGSSGTQRFVCGGSRVVRGVAGKPRFGRSLSLPPFDAPVACSGQALINVEPEQQP